MTQRSGGKPTVSTSVPEDMKQQVVTRAEAEDRLEGAVVRRALLVYLAMDLDTAEQAVRQARGVKVEPTE